MDRLVQDLRIALRGLRRSPTFAVATVLILGLGIGMAVAMWTVFDAVLVRPTPIVRPDRVVFPRALNQAGADLALTHRDVDQLRHASRTLEDMAAFEHFGAYEIPKMDGDRPLPLSGSEVDGHFFSVLGVRPALGRLLAPADDSTSHVMVLSYEAWRGYFGGDPSVIGRRFRQPQLNVTYEIVGVAPAGIDFPAGSDYWEPLAFSGLLDDVVGRLVPTASVATARAEFLAINKQIDSLRPGSPHNVTAADIRTFTTAVVGNVRPALIALFAAVCLLLVIACINVGNLLLLRVAARSREIAVRRALGASYGDIVRQLLVETALLGLVAGLVGLAVAETARRALISAAPTGLPGLDSVRLVGVPLAAAAAVALVSTTLSGVLPSLAAAHRTPSSPLKLDERSGAGSRGRRSLRQLLVGSQIALALILLSGAGLLARSLQHLESLDLGFQPSHLSVLSMSWPLDKYSDAPQLNALGDALGAHIDAVPGVEAMTPIIIPPFYGPNFFAIDWQADWQSSTEAASNPAIPLEVGGPDYFRTFQTPILEGRGFAQTDIEHSEPVVVVSQSLARRYWPGQNPIGKRLRPLGASEPWRTVVGVAGESRFRALRDATPMVYVPYRQYFWQGYIALRTTTSLDRLLPSIRRAIRATDPAVTLWTARTLDEYLARPLAQPRLNALLLSGFGLVALVLAAIGLYGIMASAISEQTREIGVRMALGATPEQLRRDVLRRALAVCATGAGAGWLGALGTFRLARSLLYGVNPADPVALFGASGLLLAVAVVAAYLPARRASRIDPARALQMN